VTHELIAAGVLVWLIGAVVGWCAGWAARTEQNRAWQAGTGHQLAAAHAELAELRDELAAAQEALDDLDHARALAWQATPTPAAVPTVVQVNLPGPIPPVVSPEPIPALPPVEGAR
jgi:type II secretory pathway component PulM